MAGTLIEKLRRMVAVGDVVKAHQGCLPLPAHMNPMGLGKLALCVVLLFALMVVGGGEHVAAGRGCAMVMVLGVYLASHTVVWGAVALAADCLRLACAAASQACYCIFPCLIKESGCFCAASAVVWVCCKLPESPIPVDFRYLRQAVSATERTKWARHVGAAEILY